MGWFKKQIPIPTGETKTITELKSYTVTWEVKSGWSDNTNKYSKVIIDEQESKDLVKSLEDAAKLINAWIKVIYYEN